MPRTAETNHSVLERRPLGSEISLYIITEGTRDTWHGMLTTVYHSIMRGNKGRGIVNALPRLQTHYVFQN
jgi:hypothetical protein